MALLKPVERRPQSYDPDYLWWCPGCKWHHGIWLAHPDYTGPTWTVKHPELPTVEPSIRITLPWKEFVKVCHVVITNGVLNYCADCTHELAGQAVPMVDFDSPTVLGYLEKRGELSA